MADERKGLMESRKVSSELRQSKKRRKEGRKGKQVELLILVIMFLPGQSISKTCYDIKYPQLSKTTYCLVFAEWLNGVCVCVHLGCNGSDRGRGSGSICTAWRIRLN